jgi:8-oxo-dGTP pyrophosphatase MutT (NUDIX family)
VRWTIHGERSLYESEWVNLRLVDVELPGGERFEHHVVRLPRPAVGTVVHDPDRGVLLLWRHRFITDTWGWEVPAGRVEWDETDEQAAARETLEETGWRPGPLRPLTAWFPSNGLCDQRFSAYLADGAEHVGDPVDRHEAERVEWVPTDELHAAVAAGQVTDGLSVTALCFAFATGALV